MVGTVCTLISFSSLCALAQKQKVPRECLTRDPSLTESVCVARLKVGAPVLPDCANRDGDAYRTCAASLPSDEILEQRRKQIEMEELKKPAAHEQLVARLKAVGIDLPPNATKLPTGHDAAQAVVDQMSAAGKTAPIEDIVKASHGAEAVELKAIQLGFDWIVNDRERATIVAKQEMEQEDQERQRLCPHGVRIGMSEDQVYACLGSPDHTNSDRSTDQLVYPGNTYVYINRATGKVEDMQWTH
jgi:hypothetical protein